MKRTVCFLLCLVWSSVVCAVDKDRLWLPTKYEIYYLSLVEAAEQAEALDRCTRVMQGTLDRGQSKPDHPIFRILCMQENGLTYNEMVDGVTMETLTTKIVREETLSPEELERRRLEEERRLAAEREALKRELFDQCESALHSETEFMTGLRWFYDGYFEPESFEKEKATFVFDFDATNPAGDQLRYRARCSVASEKEPRVRIRQRVE